MNDKFLTFCLSCEKLKIISRIADGETEEEKRRVDLMENQVYSCVVFLSQMK